MANAARGYSDYAKSPLGRFAYTNTLWVPGTNEETGRKSHNMTILFPKATTDFSGLEAQALQAALAAGWGDEAKVMRMIKDEVIRSPFLDGDGKQAISKKTGERHAGFAGNKFLRLSATVERPPKIFNSLTMPCAAGNYDKVVDGPYSGCFGYVVTSAYTWDHPTNGKGISFGFSIVQSAKDGEKLGRAAPSAERFLEKIDAGDDAPAEAKTSAGAGGLFA